MLPGLRPFIKKYPKIEGATKRNNTRGIFVVLPGKGS